MDKLDESKKFQQKWWLHPMDPENLPELSDVDRKNAKSFNGWLLIWGVMFFGITFALEPLIPLEPLAAGIENTPVWRILLAVLPLISGIFLVRAFIKMMRTMNDQLIKQIYYNAIAVGFLCAFLLGMGFNLSAEIVGHSLKAGPFIFVGLIIGYFVGLTLNYKKYNA